jgi:hypothetical protein
LVKYLFVSWIGCYILSDIESKKEEEEEEREKERKEMGSRIVWITLSLFLLAATHVRSDASDHRYSDGDPVPLYANKVGPFHNPRFISSIPFQFHSFLILGLSQNLILFSTISPSTSSSSSSLC